MCASVRGPDHRAPDVRDPPRRGKAPHARDGTRTPPPTPGTLTPPTSAHSHRGLGGQRTCGSWEMREKNAPLGGKEGTGEKRTDVNHRSAASARTEGCCSSRLLRFRERPAATAMVAADGMGTHLSPLKLLAQHAPLTACGDTLWRDVGQQRIPPRDCGEVGAHTAGDGGVSVLR